MISFDNIQYNNVINSIFVWQRSSPPFSVLSDEIGLNSSLELEWICNHKEVLLQKLMCLWFVKYTWLFVYQALCTVIICTTYFYIKHEMMRLLDEREILFWEYFEKLQHNWLFLFFSVILMISHVYYKGVEYCHLIGISLKIHEWALKKLCCWEGGWGLRKDFFSFWL